MSTTGKHQVSAVLGLAANGAWGISDSRETTGLYQLHYEKGASFKYAHLRGLVVDVNTGATMCPGSNHTEEVVTDVIRVAEHGSKIKLVNGSETILIPTETVKFFYGFDGPVIRVFKHCGTIYESSHKKLDTSKSKWVVTRNFRELFRESGGDSESLFEKDTLTSPWCYVFILVHPEVLNVSNVPVNNEGFLVLVDVHKLWDTEPTTCPYKYSHFPGYEKDPRPDAGVLYPMKELSTVSKLPATFQAPILYRQEPLTLEEANDFLLDGYCNICPTANIIPKSAVKLDHRLRRGEFILMKVDTGKGVEYYRIFGQSYAWRNSVRSDEPNLKRCFFRLLDKENDRVKKPLVMFNQTERDLILDLVDTNSTDFKSDFAFTVFLNLLASVPLPARGTVVGIYKQYRKDIAELPAWMAKSATEKKEELPDIKRLKDLISLAIKSVGRGLVADGYKAFFREVVKQENGSSLYKLIEYGMKGKRLPTSPLSPRKEEQ